MKVIKGNSSRSELRVWGAEAKSLSPHFSEMELVVACGWYRLTETCSGGDWNSSCCEHSDTGSVLRNVSVGRVRVTVVVLEKQLLLHILSVCL
jgi:hypothetical protein